MEIIVSVKWERKGDTKRNKDKTKEEKGQEAKHKILKRVLANATEYQWNDDEEEAGQQVKSSVKEKREKKEKRKKGRAFPGSPY